MTAAHDVICRALWRGTGNDTWERAVAKAEAEGQLVDVYACFAVGHTRKLATAVIRDLRAAGLLVETSEGETP